MDGIFAREPKQFNNDRNDSKKKIHTKSYSHLFMGGMLVFLFLVLLAGSLSIMPFNDTPDLSGQSNESNSNIDHLVEDYKLDLELIDPNKPAVSAEKNIQKDKETPDNKPTDSKEKPKDTTTAPTQFTVRVLNGGAGAGAAAKMKTQLEAKGYRVISIGNAVNSYEKTTIYFLQQHQENALKLADDVGHKPVLVADSIAKPADILVVLGADRL